MGEIFIVPLMKCDIRYTSELHCYFDPDYSAN